jgi:hypothetical protein
MNIGRRGWQFRLTSMDPELHDAAIALGFAPDGMRS